MELLRGQELKFYRAKRGGKSCAESLFIRVLQKRLRSSKPEKYILLIERKNYTFSKDTCKCIDCLQIDNWAECQKGRWYAGCHLSHFILKGRVWLFQDGGDQERGERLRFWGKKRHKEKQIRKWKEYFYMNKLEFIEKGVSTIFQCELLIGEPE